MRATYWICLALFAGFALGLAGCKDLDQCEDPGTVEACMCPGEDPGARTCQVEYVWSDCDCEAEVPDSGMSGGAGGMMSGGMGGTTGGMGGTTGGMGGTTGGMGGMTGGMGGMTGGVGGMPPVDGGDPDADVMTGGTGGTDPVSPGYVACTVATAAADCGAGAECRESDAPLLGGEASFVCAPACTTETDCPAAPAGGDPTLACTEGHCVLECDVFAANCPTGMACVTKGVVTSCYVQ